MPPLDLTREWLQTVLRPYPSRDRIIPEVLEVLTIWRTLSVKTDAFTFDSGHTTLLLLLHGTLPIHYRGGTYQIPIHIWLPLEYPRSPPLAFVVPTKEMGIRKGKEVEPGGRIREEIVSDWWRGWEIRSIEALLKQLAESFSLTPPVYARPPEQNASPSRPAVITQMSPQATGGRLKETPVLASPSNAGGSTTQPPPPPARPSLIPPNVHPESLPQYRPAPTLPQHPYPSNNVQTPPRQASGTYPAYQSQSPPPLAQSPPVPNRPVPFARPVSQSSGSPQAPGVPQKPFRSPPTAMPSGIQQPITRPLPGASFQAPYAGAYAGLPPPDPRYQTSQQVPVSEPVQHAHAPQQAKLSPQQPAYPQQYPTSQSVVPNPHSHPAQTQPARPEAVRPAAPPISKPRQAMPDLLSSPEASSSALPDVSSESAVPPPLPPSKPPPPSLLHLHSILLPHISASLPPLLHSLQMSRAQLLECKEDLQSGEPAIRDEMARLEAVKKVCDSVGKKMEDVVQRGDERVGDLENRGEVSVDEVVCGISIVHNQLIDLVAEDNAIEDTIYHICRALDAERIDLDRFLKSIRMLAREQYMKRALIERILQGMGQKQW